MRLDERSHITAGLTHLDVHVAVLGLQLGGHLAHERIDLAALHSARCPIGVRGTKAESVEGEHLLYSFLTTEPNSVVGLIRPKAMLVILTTPAEVALKLQRRLPDDMLEIVAENARSDQLEDGRLAGS